MYVAKCDIPWRDLPERFGKWNTVYVRFRRWAKAGIWQKLFEDLTDKDVNTLLINSTGVKFHQHSAGALNKREENKLADEAIGRSAGGLSTQDSSQYRH